MKNKVIVLFGGRSAEHEVSVHSAASVLNSIDRTLYEVIPVGISRSGQWVADVDPRELLSNSQTVVPDPPPEDGIGRIAHILTRGDVVFPLLHGTYGEDGCVQGLLEMVGVPYVGAGVTASAAGMDKVLMKNVFSTMDIPVVPYLWTTVYDYKKDAARFINSVENTLIYPLFAKPANLGSSVGITKVYDRESLISALEVAFRYDHKVLVEQGVTGREVEISVLGNDSPRVSLPGEIVPAADFYDYDAKYIAASTFLIPAEISASTRQRVEDLAISAYKAIDCSGLARVDFFVLPDEQVIVNEINTMPGFTATSMYPKMWSASGLDYSSLITCLINLALERFDLKRRISVTIRE